MGVGGADQQQGQLRRPDQQGIEFLGGEPAEAGEGDLLLGGEPGCIGGEDRRQVEGEEVLLLHEHLVGIAVANDPVGYRPDQVGGANPQSGLLCQLTGGRLTRRLAGVQTTSGRHPPPGAGLAGVGVGHQQHSPGCPDHDPGGPPLTQGTLRWWHCNHGTPVRFVNHGSQD